MHDFSRHRIHKLCFSLAVSNAESQQLMSRTSRLFHYRLRSVITLLFIRLTEHRPISISIPKLVLDLGDITSEHFEYVLEQRLLFLLEQKLLPLLDEAQTLKSQKMGKTFFNSMHAARPAWSAAQHDSEHSAWYEGYVDPDHCSKRLLLREPTLYRNFFSYYLLSPANLLRFSLGVNDVQAADIAALFFEGRSIPRGVTTVVWPVMLLLSILTWWNRRGAAAPLNPPTLESGVWSSLLASQKHVQIPKEVGIILHKMREELRTVQQPSMKQWQVLVFSVRGPVEYILSSVRGPVKDLQFDEVLHQRESHPRMNRDIVSLPEMHAIPVVCAGLVLLWPFLPVLFRQGKCLRTLRFSDAESQRYAALFLHLCASGDQGVLADMQIARLLSGMEVDDQAHQDWALAENALNNTELEQWNKRIDNLLLDMPGLSTFNAHDIRNWFLQRSGNLYRHSTHWVVQFESSAVDSLLREIAWLQGEVYLPWMPLPMLIDWPSC